MYVRQAFCNIWQFKHGSSCHLQQIGLGLGMAVKITTQKTKEGKND